ncbi:MAG: rhodanese-like domain-containing protein [Planctomycetota bacterium]|nr:rhodanese-like domain-containing protein [Planctomycetota bacterium]
MPLGTIIQRAFALGFVGVLAGAVHSVVTPVTLRPAPPAPPVLPNPPVTTNGERPADPATPAAGSTPAAGAPTQPAPLGLDIDLASAAALFAAGAPFIDARLANEYEAGHVEGAFWMPSEVFMNGAIPDALNFMDKAAPVVVYCGGGQCDASHNVVVLLQQLGFTRCHVMADGYPAWKAAGHPVATGKPAM